MWALAFGFFLASLKTIPSVLLERDLKFEFLVLVELAETLIFYLIAVALAWRGFGVLKNSGLFLKDEFEEFEIRNYFNIKIESKKIKGCRCDEVIRGLIKPTECPLFKKICTPQNPIGPCMVSSEGACSAYYLYGEI